MNRVIMFLAVVVTGIALLGANLATATTVQKFTVRELAEKSQTIVRAQVLDQASRWDDGRKEIYTYITLRILESVKGAKGETTITLRQLGGAVDNLISTVPGMPSFRRDEEVVLFLSSKDGAGYPWVMGLQQGKYSVVTDEQGLKHVRNDLDGLITLSLDGSINEAKSTTDMPLNAFLDGIKTQLNVEGKVKVDPTTPTE